MGIGLRNKIAIVSLEIFALLPCVPSYGYFPRSCTQEFIVAVFMYNEDVVEIGGAGHYNQQNRVAALEKGIDHHY